MTLSPSQSGLPTPQAGAASGQGKGATRRARRVTFGVLLRALRRRWVLGSFFGLLCAALAAGATWFLLPPAQPLVYVQLLMPEKMVANWKDHPDPPLNRQTQIGLIKNPLTLTAVLRQDEVAKLSVIREQQFPEEWLMRELRIEFPYGPELMQISMTGDRPRELMIIVQAVREVYLRDFVEGSLRDRQDRLARLIKYENTTKTEIANLREKLRKNAQEGKNVDRETIILRQKFAQEMLEFTKKELIRTKGEVRQYETELKLLTEENGQSFDPAGKYIDGILEEHPALAALKQRQAEIADLLDRTKKVAPGNPAVDRLQTEIADVQKQIDAKKQELRPKVVAGARANLLANRESAIADLKYKLKGKTEICTRLDNDISEFEKLSTKLNHETITVEDDQKQLQVLESVRLSLAGSIENLRAELDTPSRIKDRGDPAVVTTDELMRRIRFTAAAAAAALLLALLAIALLENRLQRIVSTEEIVEGLGMQVFGTVPAPPRRLSLLAAAGNPEDDGVWQTMLTESVDSFRTRLLHTARQHALQVVMVSSADSGEGKTSLACHLALSLARSGLKTVLVDADLRNPTANALFQMANVPGLCEVLRGIVPCEDALRPTPVTGLWLLPAGACNARAIELLAQEALNAVFKRLRQEFDFIVVDSSPILPVADPLLIAQRADGVVFSLMRDVSRVAAAREAIDRLHALNVFTLGAVMNGAQPSTYSYRRKYVYPTTKN